MPGIALYLIILPRIYGFSTLGQLLELFLMAVPFVLSVSFLAQFVSVWFKRRETAVVLFIAVSLPLFFQVGVSWPVEAIPDAIRSASRIFPSTSAIDGLVRINQMGASLHDVWRDWTNLWILTAIYGLLAVAAARLFARRRGRSWRLKSFRRPLAILALVVGDRIGGRVRLSSMGSERGRPRRSSGSSHETEIRIAPEINGRVESFRVSAGQTVRKGDVLATLSSPELAAAVEEAKANLATARANRANVDAGVRKEEVDTAAQEVRIAEANLALAQEQHARAATLAAKDFASKQELDERPRRSARPKPSSTRLKAAHAQDKAGPTAEERAIAEAKVAYAEAALADIEAKLAKTTLVAPVDGVVTLLVAEPGEVVSPGQPVLTLAPANERWFTFTIRENMLSGLTIGSPVRLLTAKGDRIDAKVTELRPLGEFAVWRAARAVGDHDLNSFLLRADPDEEARSVEPGMTVWIDRASTN